MTEVAFFPDGLYSARVVAVCICLTESGHCAENHHCDYHHALNCSLHNLKGIVSLAALFYIV